MIEIYPASAIAAPLMASGSKYACTIMKIGSNASIKILMKFEDQHLFIGCMVITRKYDDFECNIEASS
ncbi:MAG: hypothetical protein GKR92_09840 [Gammaproteobacteria bacterium]|nr:MAG: hypothetical protein GKR92_09840 [Gammaproteobacteria bacterium]